MRERISVVTPYRLDLTVDALRRLAANVVDVVGEDGTYYRALSDGEGTSLIAVTQPDARSLEIRATGKNAQRFIPTVAKMLGTQVDLAPWRRRAARVRWLKPIAKALDGLKPPRYSGLWEACVHAITFQQISIHAAAAIMRRTVEALGEPYSGGPVRCIAFPSPERFLEAPEEALIGAGLSLNKRVHLHAAARAIVDGDLREERIEALPTPAATEELVRTPGIGPWSAAVVLLRGFGRLDTFPMRDSGVARSVRLLAGEDPVDLDADLATLGPTRGMLYYHLLLGRLRNLGALGDDS